MVAVTELALILGVEFILVLRRMLQSIEFFLIDARFPG